MDNYTPQIIGFLESINTKVLVTTMIYYMTSELLISDKR